MALLEILGKAFTKVFKTSSERYVRKREEFVEQINELEETYSQLTDAQLRAKTDEFRQRIAGLEDQIIEGDLRGRLRQLQLLPEEARKPAKARLTSEIQACCEDVVCEAFAVVREASDRYLGIRNVFDDSFSFDSGILSPAAKDVFDQAKKQITDEQNINQIELPVSFYNELREHFTKEDRTPFRYRHFDVQLIGGNVLYEGTIAEMSTGEGKTLVATLAAYLVALSGRKVHIVTVNDYLAQRDRDWMGPTYEALGLSVGAIQSDMETMGKDRQSQYGCDIAYGTNNEFGFDYLRDNMKVSADEQVQGPLDYVIIDEVDSILIDEARTPLIISGPAKDDTARYKQAEKIAQEMIRLQKDYDHLALDIDKQKRLFANAQGEISDAKKAKAPDRVQKAEAQEEQSRRKLEELESKLLRTTQYYEVEYDRHSVHLTHEGIGAAQDQAGVGSFFVGSNMEWPHLMEQALRAHVVFLKEKDYVVQDGEVIIVDEFTGRLMHGRQWSDGLHQAIEAKENVRVKQESQTLATITIQNFFRLYQQLAGMTGTAMTEAEEFMKIYQLNVISIPTNKPVVRDDREDMIYKTMNEKFDAIVEEIYQVSRRGQPILIGTVSIEKNEALSAALQKKYGMDHEVLNAKQHAREASIIIKAGHQHHGRDGKAWGNITIATNMAGRGTDIKLGPGVADIGGLYVLGTERHEARRIDNQLRGRGGRQGDDGTSQFFLSFEDELMRVFAPEWTVKALGWIGWQEGEPIYHKRISKGVEKAQKKVEQRNFEARKSLLDYDEVMDYQRQVFYTRRQSILEGRNPEGMIWKMIDEIIDENCGKMLSNSYSYECVAEWARTTLALDIELDRINGSEQDDIEQTLRDLATNNAEQEINVTLGEYMSDDMEKSEWDLKGLSSWAMSRFGVNISQSQLRKISPTEVEEMLSEAAANRIEKTDLSKMDVLLDKGYGKRCLREWANQKFGFSIETDELTDKPTEQIVQTLGDRVRQVYRRREIEYPVDFILSISLRGQSAGSGYAAKMISDWVKHKYRQEIPVEEVQNLSYEKVHKRLLAMSESYQNGKLTSEIDEAFSKCQNGQQSMEQLIHWANERYELDIKTNEITEDNARSMIEHGARRFLRSELSELERYVLLQIYDATWKDHLYAMDHLKSGIGLRGFAEKDPKIEYKREGFRMFEEMLSNIRNKVTDIIFKVEMGQSEDRQSVWNISAAQHVGVEQFSAQQAAAQAGHPEQKVKTIKLDKPKVGRNAPCPCGSGKKYKKCHGRAT